MPPRSALAVPMRALTLRALLLTGVAFALTSCGDDGFEPGVPAKVVMAERGFTFTALGQNHLFPAAATDAHGNLIRMSLIWSSSDPAVVQVNGDGLATATGPGSAVVTVSAGAHTDSATVTVRQVAAHLAAVQGDGQGGIASQMLPGPLVVQVTDRLNRPVGGVLVHFATSDPGAVVAPDTATTDRNGFAATTLTLGSTPGNYSVTATVTGTALSAGFTARTAGPFSIDLLFVNGTPTPAQAQAFNLARQRWETIITADLPDDYASLGPGSCGASPAIDRPIDDLLIFVSISDIDGPGGILGQAAPCFLHSVGFLPAIGQMTFDAADLAVIDSVGLLSAVVTHEMGHVLGYGTLWNSLGLLANPSSQGGLDPYFTGPLAIAAFDSLGGIAHVGGKVPVEDQGGPGTADSHWRETTFGNELMTGYVNLGSNPLSAVSVASMADLGYAVDITAAEPYTIFAPLRMPGSEVQFHMRNDVAAGPVRVLPRRPKAAGPNRR